MPLRCRIACLLVGLVAVAGCGNAGAPAGRSAAGSYPVTVRNCGQEVTIEQRPRRVFLLGNESVSLLSAVGALDRVVARSGQVQPELYDGATRAALRRTSLVGGGTSGSGTDRVSLEAVIAQRPDVVVGYLPDNSSVTRAGLARAGIPLLVPPAYCSGAGPAGPRVGFADVYARVRLYGRVFDASGRAAQAVAELRQRVAAVTPPGPPQRGARAAALFVYPRGTPPSAYGARSVVHAQLTALGLNNVFGGVGRRNFEIGTEVLLAKDPDVVVLLHVAGDRANVLRRFRAVPGTGQLTAVRRGRVLVQPFGFSGSATPLAVAGLERLAGELRATTRPAGGEGGR